MTVRLRWICLHKHSPSAIQEGCQIAVKRPEFHHFRVLPQRWANHVLPSANRRLSNLVPTDCPKQAASLSPTFGFTFAKPTQFIHRRHAERRGKMLHLALPLLFGGRRKKGASAADIR